MPAVTAVLAASRRMKKNNRGVFIDYKNYYGDYRYRAGGLCHPDRRHCVCWFRAGIGIAGLV